MEAASYVVHLIDADDPHPLKHFGARSDAIAFAKAQTAAKVARRADIYEVRASGARAAVAAVMMGDGLFVESRGERVTEDEQERSNRLNRLRGIRWEDLFPGTEGP